MNVEDGTRILKYIGDHQKRTGQVVLDGRTHLLSVLIFVLPFLFVILERDLCLLQIVIHIA